MTDWSSGDAYEPYVGRWSRLVAAAFVPRLGVPPGARWVDVGCGTGALAEAVLRLAGPQRLLGVDLTVAYAAHARTHVTDPRAGFVAASATALPLPDASVDAAVSGLVLNFVPRPETAAAEMLRVTRPGGTVGVYVWDYTAMGFITAFWQAVAALDPAAGSLDEAVRFPLCAEEPLAALFAGLRDLRREPVTVPTVFRDFADLWTPFLGAQGPAPAYLATLPPERQAAVRDRLRERLPSDPDGSIPLTARAWAVRGTVPT